MESGSDATPQGMGTPAPEPATNQAATPEPAQAAASVSLPQDLVDALYADRLALQQLRARHEEDDRERQSMQTRVAETQAQLDRYRQSSEARIDRLARDATEAAVASTIAQGLVGVQIRDDVPNAARQVMDLLRPMLQTRVDQETGRVIVTDAAGRPGVDVIRQMVAGREFAHFRAPVHMGGSVSPVAPQKPPLSAPNQKPSTPPTTLSEALQQHLQAGGPLVVTRALKTPNLDF